ncbi:hypothetical protein GCM10010145_13800 [Streptomyces ruber]|uniref:Uncharacterized protein n=2 Tax=Streptomyces TaxID=1883 RepID=A0A918B9N9_9ACTN|nr:hypothetical protein GCM10010145_13800 [Streptomyces ruber]
MALVQRFCRRVRGRQEVARPSSRKSSVAWAAWADVSQRRQFRAAARCRSRGSRAPDAPGACGPWRRPVTASRAACSWHQRAAEEVLDHRGRALPGEDAPDGGQPRQGDCRIGAG